MTGDSPINSRSLVRWADVDRIVRALAKALPRIVAGKWFKL